MNFSSFLELPCIDKLQKSLVMGSTKNKGEILYPGDVKIKVAEPKGLNALHFEEVIYKTLVCDKKEDEPLNEGDFCWLRFKNTRGWLFEIIYGLALIRI